MKLLDLVGVGVGMGRWMLKQEQFIVKRPNWVWSIDEQDRLSRLGFEIYAVIDVYLQYIVWCYIGDSNQRAITVNSSILQLLA